MQPGTRVRRKSDGANGKVVEDPYGLCGECEVLVLFDQGLPLMRVKEKDLEEVEEVRAV